MKIITEEEASQIPLQRSNAGRSNLNRALSEMKVGQVLHVELKDLEGTKTPSNICHHINRKMKWLLRSKRIKDQQAWLIYRDK